MRRFAICLVLVAVVAVVTMAEVPRIISYQGIISGGPSSMPITGTHELTFRLYDNESGMTLPLWTETHLGVQVQHGIFSVYLGNANPFGEDVDFSKQYWLGISLDSSPEMSPRFRLSATPYAMNIPSMGAEDGQVLKWNADSTKWVPSDDDFGCWSPAVDSADRDKGCVPWLLTDEVVYTAIGNPNECRATFLGISKGEVNTIAGTDNLETHVNLGGYSTTGCNGQAYSYPTIGGGKDNTASKTNTTVAGGERNTASGEESVVSGGSRNTASGYGSVVSGGSRNTVSGDFSAVPGGSRNNVSGDYSFAFGNDVDVSGNYRAVFFDGSNPGRLGVNTDSLLNASLDVRGDAIFNEDGGNNDFRIEGDTDQNLFFVDASTNRIGIGTNTPGSYEKLSIYQGNLAVDNGVEGLHTCLLASSSSTYAAMIFRKNGTRHAGIRWDGSKLEIMNASHSHHDPDIWDAGSITALATFDIDGDKVGIGTTTPEYKLDVDGDIGISGNLDLSAGTIILDSDGNPSPGAGYVLKSDEFEHTHWRTTLPANCAPWKIRTPSCEDAKVLYTGCQTQDVSGEYICEEKFLAVAKGGFDPPGIPINNLYGDNKETHVNLGGYSTTGVSGETYDYCTISGGYNNTVTHSYSFIGGGEGNYADSSHATICGGLDNEVFNGGFVGGGAENKALFGLSVVCGGLHNWNSGGSAAIVSGEYNEIEYASNYSFIGAGWSNYIDGEYSTIPGGLNNDVIGNCSFAFGNDVDITENYRAVFFKDEDGKRGRLGVNAVSPDASLDVRGDAVFNNSAGDYDFRIEGMTDENLFFIDASSDRVGIGTTSPGKKLDVRGDAIFNEDGGDNDFRIEGDTEQNLFFVDASTDRIGIGTASPGEKLEVNGKVTIGDRLADTEYTLPDEDGDDKQALITNGSGVVTWENTSDIDWEVSGNDVITGHGGIYPSGNVGIGTTTPSYKLEVEKTISTNGGSTGWFKINVNTTTGYSFNYSGVVGSAKSLLSPNGNYNYGVKGYADDGEYNTGVYGLGTDGSACRGVIGEAKRGTEVNTGVKGVGYTEGVSGVYTWGVHGTAWDGWGEAERCVGVGGYGNTDPYEFCWAGYFDGDVNIIGDLTKGSGAFLIDHPLDPTNKTLRHNFVESPENLCIYRGKVELNVEGKGIVNMPDYFSALTREDEATIQLTPINRPFLVAYKWNIDFTEFTVTGEPGESVSYTVYADRDDPVVKQFNHPVEEVKGQGNNWRPGKLLYPVAYGYPEEMGENWEAYQLLHE